MSDLFYCPEIRTPTSLLEDSEAHHAINVLRMKTGDEIRLFDGNGTTADGKIGSLRRRDVVVETHKTITHQRKRPFKLTVAASPPKGDRLKWMVEKLAELGVDRFVPLQTERTVVQPGTSKLKKLSSTIISAAKQSGCLWLMEVAEPTRLESLLAEDGCRFCLAHPGLGGSPASFPPEADQTVIVGPEGGFTDAEVQHATTAGVKCISWPGSILRIETAAVVFASAALLSNRPSSL